MKKDLLKSVVDVFENRLIYIFSQLFIIMSLIFSI